MNYMYSSISATDQRKGISYAIYIYIYANDINHTSHLPPPLSLYIPYQQHDPSILSISTFNGN